MKKLNDDEILEKVISFEAIFESMMKCKKGVIWKDSAARFHLNGIEQSLKLSRELHDGTYKGRPPKKFMITSPKPREAVSIAFRDRVYQRSMNDNVIHPLMSQQFIFDNLACQKGKSTDKARDRLWEFLHSFYRKHGIDGYVLKCDIHGYYSNMRHDVAEGRFREKLPPVIYRRTETVLREQYKDDVGYNHGSQLIQIAGISVLSPLDHYIKEQLGIKYYLRYMDDFILIHESEEHLSKGDSHKLIQRYREYYEKIMEVAEMPKFNPIKTTVAASREQENMKADIERNKAHNDYIAMMCDVELPEPTKDMEVIHHEE